MFLNPWSLPALLLGLLLGGWSATSHAFTCASGATVGSRLTVTVLNSTVPCAAGQWAVYSPVEVTALQTLQTNFAAFVAQPATGATVAQITALQTQINQLAVNNGYLPAVFDMPVSADIAQAWMLGFALPMMVYLVAFGFGVVINMFKDG